MKNRNGLISFGSVVALVGFILSGPIGFLAVQILKPQPAWVSAEVFISNYSPLQNIPYYFGFILVGGMLIFTAAHYINADNEKDIDKLYTLLSLICTTIFSAFIFFNYICQTTFIHHLANNYKPEYDTLIATLSMANPKSLSWSMEMWGYAILGVATWLLSAFYRAKNKVIYALLIINGIVSILSAVLFIINTEWLLTITGLISYFFWNLLMIVLLFLTYRHSKNL